MKQMKKLMFFVMVAALSTGAYAYKDGTYTGVGNGNASQIEVKVTVANGKVSKVDVVKQGETPMIFAAVEGALPEAVVAANGTKGVEAITGASNSSKGFLEAVNKALEQAQ